MCFVDIHFELMRIMVDVRHLLWIQSLVHGKLAILMVKAVC